MEHLPESQSTRAAGHSTQARPELEILRRAGQVWPAGRFDPQTDSQIRPDLSVRTVQQGTHMGDRFIRVSRASHREFRAVAPGEVRATQAIPRAQSSLGRFLVSARMLVIGDPLANERAAHERLTKVKALAILSSDALSSVAYATESMIAVLLLAGSAALGLSLWIALAIAALFTIVAVSYRQTIKAYPRGGGSYIVARDNLGDIAGLVAGSSIMIDYTLTVAVSISAGVYALVSLVPTLASYQIPMDIGFVAVLVLGNLRGIRESGTIFMVPTYLFIAGIYITIVLGCLRLAGIMPAATIPPQPSYPVAEGLTVFLILRAFASGCTALTGVEAISDGTPAFQPTEWRNARTTLTVMAAIAITMFLGISLLSHSFHLLPEPSGTPTVLSKLASVAGGQGLFIYVQLTTALILALGANTAYSDFPRLCYFMARDHFLPHQFAFRGDRLSYSNGILTLTLLVIILIIAFQGKVDALINLYVIGVFASFTLSQTGMVRRWWTRREIGWQKGLWLNGTGAVVTGLVLLITASTKFLLGAWFVVALVPVMVLGFSQIKRHYKRTGMDLIPHNPRGPDWYNHTVIIAATGDAMTNRAALDYATATRAHKIIIAQAPTASATPHPPMITTSDQHDCLIEETPVQAGIAGLDALLQRITATAPTTSTVTIVAPEGTSQRLWELERSRLVAIVGLAPPRTAPIFRHTAVVLVAGLDQSALQALAYARSLTSERVIAIHVAPEEDKAAFRERWDAWGDHVPLVIIDSPYRAIVGPVLSYIRALDFQDPEDLITVVLPEVVPKHRWERALHGHVARRLRRLLLERQGTAVISVPFGLS